MKLRKMNDCEVKNRLLVLGGTWPRILGNREAADVVTHEILSYFLNSGEWDVSFCVVTRNVENLSVPVYAELDALVSRGLRILDPINVPRRKATSRTKRFTAMLLGDPALLLDGVMARRLVEQAVADCDAAAVLTVWSEAATAAAAETRAVKCAYYGNPDHKVVEARVRFEWSRTPFGLGSAYRYVRGLLAVNALRRAHLDVMRRYALVADVAANDSAFYRAHGVENARYLRNMWPGVGVKDWRERRRREEQLSPIKIVASVGNLSATGNTLGLDTLARHVLPALNRRLTMGAFELHLFGARLPHPLIAPLLEDPHIKIRGFVEDLDGEMLSAPVFLVANNHSYFKVGHTRFLHAWSLGACVVAFRDSAEAMPEIVHGQNALLASSAEEMAELVEQAVSDRSLRERLGEGGRNTLLDKFGSQIVCVELGKGIFDAFQKVQAAGAPYSKRLV